MKKLNFLVFTLTVIALAACGKAEAADGKINGKDFTIRGAGLSKDPYIMGMYQLLVYPEAHGSACYGLGDTFIKIPVSQTNTVGRHDLQNNRVWSALFYDVGREYREASGYTVVNAFDSSGGSATLVIGAEGSANYLRGDVRFENCIRD